jgi:hypothetical protein
VHLRFDEIEARPIEPLLERGEGQFRKSDRLGIGTGWMRASTIACASVPASAAASRVSR